QVSDKQLSAAFDEDAKLIPAKKTALIASLPRKIFSTEELLSFIKKENISIAKLIKPQSKEIADKLMEMFKDDPYYGYMIAAAANGLWIGGYHESAVYLLGKATEAIPNADNYNNYASCLTMMGAAHIAIPILQKLNSVHKNNSTVLNNLGQAWLQLGDENMGEKYIDSAIKIYAYHPQANYTKALLEQSRGKTAEAVHALENSLKHSITQTKLNKLKELGDKQHKLRGYNVPRVYYSSSFKLDEYAAMVPQAYAFELGQGIERQWEKFKQSLNDEIEKLEREIEKAKQQEEDELKEFKEQTVKQGGVIYPPYYHHAVQRYNTYLAQQQKTIPQDAAVAAQYGYKLAALKTQFLADMKTAEDKFREENTGAIDNCPEQIPIINGFLQQTNRLNQEYNINHIRIWIADAYNQYYFAPQLASVDASALKAVLSIKLDFLKKLRSLKHESDVIYSCNAPGEGEPEYKMKQLPDYDEVNCHIENKITAPGFGEITMRCNNMTMELNPFLLPFSGTFTKNFDDGHWEEVSVAVELKAVSIGGGVKFDKDGNVESGEANIGKKIGGVKVSAGVAFDEKGFKKSSIELGISNSLKFAPKILDEVAPVEISLQNKLGVGMEVGRGEDGSLISDYYVKQSTSGSIADNIDVLKDIEMTPEQINFDDKSNRLKVTNAETTSITAGSAEIKANSRWGTNSGYSGKASSSLSSLTIQ
ncbi:MAG: hypothetical protein HYR66_09990, partial [Sphingobacteriales bacterium]|nr:hypothetical protein [Sphingobacteriales bacterium]